VPVVTKQITLPGSGVARQVRCLLSLYASTSGESFGYGTTGDIGSTTEYKPDNSGLVSFGDLEPNTTIDPTGTVYRIVTVFPDRARLTEYIIVPDEAGPFEVAEILSSEPGALAAPGTVAAIEELLPEALAAAGEQFSSLDEAPTPTPNDGVLVFPSGVAHRATLEWLAAELLAGHMVQSINGDVAYDPANYLGVKNVNASSYTLTLPALDGDDPRHVMFAQQLSTGTITVAAGASAQIQTTMTATAGKGQMLLCVAAGKVLGVTQWYPVLLGGSAGGGTVDVVSNVATSTILGRVTGGSGNSEELTPAQVRTLLGLVIGTDVQAVDADLTAIAALSTTSYGRSLLELANVAALRTSLGSLDLFTAPAGTVTWGGFSVGTGTASHGAALIGANVFVGGFLNLYKNTADTQPAIQIRALDGKILIGPGGSTAPTESITYTSLGVLTLGATLLRCTTTPVSADDLTRKGYVDGRTPAASDTASGLVELATAAEVSTGSDTARAITPAGGAATYQRLDAVGRLIGLTSYSPTVTATYTSATSATLADVDATNLSVTFTPLTSAVYIEVLIRSQVSGGSSVNCSIGLREGSSDVKSTTDQYTAAFQWRSVGFHVDGLTPGVALTYKLAYGGSGAQTISITAGDSVGAPSIKVFAA
jgi:hypothetical protein